MSSDELRDDADLDEAVQGCENSLLDSDDSEVFSREFETWVHQGVDDRDGKPGVEVDEVAHWLNIDGANIAAYHLRTVDVEGEQLDLKQVVSVGA